MIRDHNHTPSLPDVHPDPDIMPAACVAHNILEEIIENPAEPAFIDDPIQRLSLQINRGLKAFLLP
ncbi:hypothetical protein D3C81_1732780 [compost metagenome]